MTKSIHLFRSFLVVFAVFAVPTLLLAHTGAPGHTHTVALTLSGPSDTWLPTADETLTLTASISDPGNAQSSAAVKFELKNVSAWKGTAMNSEDDSTSPDLAFYSTGFFGIGNKQPKARKGKDEIETNWESGKDGDTSFVKATCPDAKPTLFTVKIRVKDYAAYGELTATLYSANDAKKDWASHTITIPKDTNGNYIGDAWHGDGTTTGSSGTAGYDPDIDSEVGPGATQTVNTVEHNGNPGDGFVVFEEYRGFFVNGLHQRLDPHRKDVFVHSEFSQYGIGDASNLPAVFQIHQITEDETKDTYKDRTVNFHALGTPQQYGAGADAAWHVLAQYALWVTKSGEGGRSLGRVELIESGRMSFGAPAEVKAVHIYDKTISADSASLIRNTSAMSKDQIFKYVIGHEIGHGLGLYHPWRGEVQWRGFWWPQGVINLWQQSDLRLPDIPPTPRDVGSAEPLNPLWYEPQPGALAVLSVSSYSGNQTLGQSGSSFARDDNYPYSYEYGTSIMDYPIKAHYSVRVGIFPDDTYHVLHNWEYSLIPHDVTRRTTSNHTRRTTIVGNAPHVSTSTHTHDIHEDTSSPSELPTITNIAFANAGPYHAFANNAYMPIHVRVDFSAPVDIYPGVRLLLDIGGQLRKAFPLKRKSDSRILRETNEDVTTAYFRYNVRPDDRDTDGVTLHDADTTTPGMQPFSTYGELRCSATGSALNKPAESVANCLTLDESTESFSTSTTYTVNAQTPPRITDIAFVTRGPYDYDDLDKDAIRVKVTFSEGVDSSVPATAMPASRIRTRFPQCIRATGIQKPTRAPITIGLAWTQNRDGSVRAGIMPASRRTCACTFFLCHRHHRNRSHHPPPQCIRVACIGRAPRATIVMGVAHQHDTASSVPATAMPAARIHTRFQAPRNRSHHRHHRQSHHHRHLPFCVVIVGPAPAPVNTTVSRRAGLPTRADVSVDTPIGLVTRMQPTGIQRVIPAHEAAVV